MIDSIDFLYQAKLAGFTNECVLEVLNQAIDQWHKQNMRRSFRLCCDDFYTYPDFHKTGKWPDYTPVLYLEGNVLTSDCLHYKEFANLTNPTTINAFFISKHLSH